MGLFFPEGKDTGEAGCEFPVKIFVFIIAGRSSQFHPVVDQFPRKLCESTELIDDDRVSRFINENGSIAANGIDPVAYTQDDLHQFDVFTKIIQTLDVPEFTFIHHQGTPFICGNSDYLVIVIIKFRCSGQRPGRFALGENISKFIPVIRQQSPEIMCCLLAPAQ